MTDKNNIGWIKFIPSLDLPKERVSIVKETGEYVTIAQNYGLKPEQVCNLITIPKCSIISIKEYGSNNNE